MNAVRTEQIWHVVEKQPCLLLTEQQKHTVSWLQHSSVWPFDENDVPLKMPNPLFLKEREEVTSLEETFLSFQSDYQHIRCSLQCVRRL